MAAGATQTPHAAAPLPAAPMPAPQIQRELARTGRRIKWVDLLSWMAIWMTGTLALLLAATIVDHWLLDLGRAGRFAAWLTLALGSLWVLARHMLPLLLRRINPVYSARSIEEGAPGLKNSLVNFLTVGRADPALVDALAEQAAADLQRVDPELAVDRSRLIRTFLVLAVVVALSGIYTIRAPKSPFDTALRVLAPWSDRARPSRVKIGVAPGDAEVVRGGTIVVRVELEGRLRDDESVTALLTSADGQLQQQPVQLQQIGDSNVWQATLPSSGGLQQPCDYHVTAGDGRSPTYHLTLLPAPTIDVREARYQPPAYTGLPERTSVDPDLLGVDGAWVNLVAEANEPIQTALIELGPRPGGRPAATVAMRVEGRQARGRFQLELDADGRPVYGAYQVTFVNLRGDECLDPILHRIEVQADLKPVVEVLDPLTPIVEVPEDGQVEFKVRGLDPDFGLQSLSWVMAPSAGPPQTIERSYNARRGPVVESFRLIPSQRKWKAGLEIVCHAEATDNRPRVAGRERAASRSDAYRVRITAARNPSAAPAGDKPEDKTPEDKPEDKPQQKTESDPSQPPQDGGGESQDQGQPGGQGDGKQGKQGGGDADGNSGQTSADGKQDDPQAGAGESGDAQGGGGKPQQQGEKPAQSGASGQPKAGEGSGSESGTGAASGDNARERGGSSGAPNSASQPQSGGESGQQAPQEPLHDGEVFDRIRERLEEGGGADRKPQGGSDQRAEGDGNRAADSLPSEDAAGQKGSPSPGVDERGTPAGDAESGAQPTQLPPQPGDSKTGERPTGRQGEKPGGEGLERDLGQGQARQAEPGRGGNPQGPTEAKPEEADVNREKGPMSDPGQGDNGDSSETNTKGGQKSGAPASQEANRDTDKSRTPKKGTSDDEAESPPSPSQDKNQRDIDGGEGGDRSGAGEKGGGQGGKREGNDSAGSHSSADEGAGASPESGQGETAQRAGNKQTGQTPTGATGEAPGSGSERRDAASGEGAGGKPADDPQATPQGATGGAEASRGEGGAPTGGGLPSERSDRPADAQRDAGSPPPPLTPRDKANLDYASQATDLVLNYLSEQQRAPDPKLLEDLNWTAEDLEKFVQRWKAMKAAGRQSEAARRELHDAMLSLGLRPAATSTRTTSGGAGAGAIDSGDRSEPPPAYRGKFNAFKRGRR